MVICQCLNLSHFLSKEDCLLYCRFKNFHFTLLILCGSLCLPLDDHEGDLLQLDGADGGGRSEAPPPGRGAVPGRLQWGEYQYQAGFSMVSISTRQASVG